MRSASATLLMLSISLDLPVGRSNPYECYTCQSPIDDSTCGDYYGIKTYNTRYCVVNQFYCIKIIETAGRKPVVYRKCSEFDCEQEKQRREGRVSECTVCTTSLCNKSSKALPALPLIILIMAIFLYLSSAARIGEYC